MVKILVKLANKCKIYGGCSFLSRLSHNVDMFGLFIEQTPINYLGVPIFNGKPKCHYLCIIVDRVLVKLETWKSHLLSMMGRIQLVRSVIQGIIIYSFRIY